MKIVCPNCQKILDVEEGALSVTCDQCESSFEMQDAKAFTNGKYKEYQNLGYNNLYLTLNFPEAYKNYSKALEIRPNDLSSVMGLCLTKTSMSQFDKTYFYEVTSIIDAHEIYLNLENTFLFLNFIGDMLDQINFYFNELDYRCIEDGTFINKAIFDEYAKTLIDIKDLLAYLRSSFDLMDQKELNSFFEEHEGFQERLETREKDVQERLNATYNVNHFGDIKLNEGESTILGENKKDLEKDTLENMNMVVRNDDALKVKKIYLPIVGVLGVISLVFLILFLTLKNNVFAYVFGGCLALTIGAYFLYRYKLKKTFRQ